MGVLGYVESIFKLLQIDSARHSAICFVLFLSPGYPTILKNSIKSCDKIPPTYEEIDVRAPLPAREFIDLDEYFNKSEHKLHEHHEH